jgi:hypothetical protein
MCGRAIERRLLDVLRSENMRVNIGKMQTRSLPQIIRATTVWHAPVECDTLKEGGTKMRILAVSGQAISFPQTAGAR